MKKNEIEIASKNIHEMMEKGKLKKRAVTEGTELEIMTREHPRWDEFCDRLEGPEGCNFRQDENGKWIWDCDNDQSLAIAILEKMGAIDIPDSLEYFEEHGGYCDCEILMNVDREEE
jgi:hypothetical protein